MLKRLMDLLSLQMSSTLIASIFSTLRWSFEAIRPSCGLTRRVVGGDEPDRITINTMSRQLIFTNPRLIFFSNNLVVLSALSDRDPSGTLHHVKKFYIEMDNSCEH